MLAPDHAHLVVRLGGSCRRIWRAARCLLAALHVRAAVRAAGNCVAGSIVSRSSPLICRAQKTQQGRSKATSSRPRKWLPCCASRPLGSTRRLATTASRTSALDGTCAIGVRRCSVGSNGWRTTARRLVRRPVHLAVIESSRLDAHEPRPTAAITHTNRPMGRV